MDQVYLYLHDLRASGVVRNALAYADRLARDRPTTLIAGAADGLFAARTGGRGFAFAALADAPGPLPRLAAVPRLRGWLRARPPGVLLSVGNHGHPTCYWATRGLGHVLRVYRISSEVSRADGPRSAVRRLWMRMLARDAARIILVGAAHRNRPPFASLIAQGRAIEVANGVDVAAARALATAPCPHPWLEEDVPVVLGIGRLRPQKNFDLLIEAIARARTRRRLRLLLLGGGAPAERARMEEVARAAGVGDDVALVGETDNVFAWLARASAFALPSRWEGSSMALLEALAVGVPVVASSRAGDAARVLRYGRHGLLFDGTSAVALAEALLTQTSDHPVRPGDRAHDFPPSAEGYAAIVAELLSARAIASGPRPALGL